MSEYPNHVPMDERPDRTIENIPDDVIEKAISTCQYKECPHCGHRQWFNYVPGHNSSAECKDCGEEVPLVG